MNSGDGNAFGPGLARLKKPVLPLVHMVQFLYLRGPVATIEEVLGLLTKPVELENVLYEKPQDILRPYGGFLQEFEILKGRRKPASALPFIVNEKDEPVAKRQALELWIRQQILSRELETINSLLCGPCGCVLCCTGPNSSFDGAAGFKGRMRQEFFEIPLAEAEVGLFGIPRVDTPESHATTAHADPPLLQEGLPFYRREMALYHWQNGWSLILPEGSACPRLAVDTKKCLIYDRRPEVCRKPQLFAYVLEKTDTTARRSDGETIPVFMARNKILAVWDCPYVRKFQDEIGKYAELGRLEPVFKKSKI